MDEKPQSSRTAPSPPPPPPPEVSPAGELTDSSAIDTPKPVRKERKKKIPIKDDDKEQVPIKIDSTAGELTDSSVNDTPKPVKKERKKKIPIKDDDKEYVPIETDWEKPELTVSKDKLTGGPEDRLVNQPTVYNSSQEELIQALKSKQLLGEMVEVKAVDPKSKTIKGRVRRYTDAKKVEGFAAATQRPGPDQHRDPSFQKVYSDFLARKVGKIKKEHISLKVRLKDFWVTKEMVEGHPDMEYRLKVALAEFCTFLTFVILVTTLLWLDVYPSVYKYHFTHSVSREFIQTRFKNYLKQPLSFYDIKSPGDVITYLLRRLCNGLYPTYYYNQDDMRISNLGFFDNNPIFEDGLIGVPRITMKKVKNNSCLVSPMFQRQFKLMCYTAYSPANEDFETLGSNVRWDYHKGDSSDTSSWGEFAHYPVGGFEQLLYWKSDSDSRLVLTIMKNEGWITLATRVIIVEFLLFNPTINFFCKVRLIFEFPPEGGVHPIAWIHTVKLIFPTTVRDYIIIGLVCVLGVFGIYYLIETIKQVLSLKMHYLRYFRHIYDVLICLLTLYIFIYLLLKIMIFRPKINGLIRIIKKRQYTPIDNLVFLETIYMQLAGLLLFFAYIKLFLFIHFTRLMSIINKSIIRSIRQVMGFLLFFVIVMCAYAFVAQTLFGMKSEYFRNWLMSLFSLYKVLLGDFDYTEFERSDRYVGPIFFTAYLCTVYFFLVNMFAAIIVETYSRTRLERERYGIEYSLPYGKILERGFYNIFGFIQRPSFTVREQKRAKQALMRVKKALLNYNFSLPEINMFFSKYGIDGSKPIHPQDVHRILKDFEQKGHIPIEAPTTEEILADRKLRRHLVDDDILTTDKYGYDWTGLTIQDFVNLMTRLRSLEKEITKTSRRVAVIGELIQMIDTKFWSSSEIQNILKKDKYKLWYPPGMTAKHLKRWDKHGKRNDRKGPRKRII